MRYIIATVFFIIMFSTGPIFSDEKIEKKARPYFVYVEFEVLKNESFFIDGNNYDEFQGFFENKKKIRTYGIPINENTIIIDHMPLMANRFKNIKIKTFDGKEFSAELDGYGLNRDLQTLKIKESLPIIPKVKDFNPNKTLGPLYSTTLAFREIYPYILMKDVSSTLTATAFFKDETEIFPLEEIDMVRGPALILNKKGEPVCFQTKSFYKIKNKYSTFSNSEIKIINIEDLRNKEEEMIAMLHKEICFVQITFRQKSDEDSYNSDSATAFAPNSPEAKILGILINEKGDFLLPYNIPIEKIKDIENIEIKTPGKTFEAYFKCAYATLGATIITCEQFKGIKPKINFNQPIPEDLILTSTLSWNSPEDYQLEVSPNRLDYREYGVNDRISYATKHSLKNNQTLFLNTDMRICGIYSKFKNIENLLEEEQEDFQYGPNYLSFIAMADIEDELKNPEKYSDSRAIQLNRQDALSPTWLGVNVQSPSTALLEHLKVLDKTKNGSVGVLVTQTYANSPASKIGLKPLDILLSVTYENSDREFEFLKSNEFGSYNYNQFDINSNGVSLFPSSKNEVTNVLSRLETGKTVILKYLRDGKVLTAPFVLEKAPKDFSNADKFVDDDFGLHVKDITYEVRDSLRLKENENGVIISEVEQGKAADIAQLRVYFIITKVDSTPITSISNFKDYINAKKSAGVTEFSFTILFLGKTSLIKVNLKS